jgi:hypothetical protein
VSVIGWAAADMRGRVTVLLSAQAAES